MSDEMLEILEGLDWSVHKYESKLLKGIYGDFYDLEWYSPAGEDYVLTLIGNTDEELERDFFESFYVFNIDRHAYEWYGKNNGEPSSLEELLEDAKAIWEHLRDTSIALFEFVRKEKL